MKPFRVTLSASVLMVMAGGVDGQPLRNFQRPATPPPRFVAPAMQSFPSFHIPSGSFTPLTATPAMNAAFPRTIFPPRSSNNPFVAPFTGSTFNPFFPSVGASLPLTAQGITDPVTRLSTNSAISQAGLNAAFNAQPMFPNDVVTASLLSNQFHPWFNPYLNPMNPSMYGGGSYGASPAAYGSGYGSTSTSGGGYGGSGYGGTGYGGSGGGPDYANAATAALNTAVAAGASLDVLGFVLHNGHLDWPLGIRTLAPSEQTSLLQRRIDAMLSLMAYQLASGRISPTLIDEAKRTVGELRRRLESKATDFPQYTYQEARWFLDQLERSLTVLK